MALKIIFGIIFLLAGIFQTITIFMIYKGHYHYMLKVTNKRNAMIFYGIFAFVLYAIGFRILFFHL